MDELDARYSGPDATATPWAEVEGVLDAAQTSWITTVRRDGRPHVTPLVAVWLEGAVWFCTGPDEQKAVNLRTNQHVVVTTGCNDWQHGLDVIVEGIAERVTDESRLRRAAEAWTRKWDGSWEYEVRDGAFHHHAGEAWVFAVVPRKVLSFHKEHVAATRHLL